MSSTLSRVNGLPASAPRPEVQGTSFGAFFVLELRETALARWFQLYVLGFAGLMGLFFAFGLAESQVMGFHGLGRLLLTFIQVSLVILPIFVLITTARTLVGDRESGVWEYMLALPVSLSGYYWGRFVGRSLAIALPLALALMGGAAVEQLRGGQVPWGVAGYYTAMVAALTGCFLGVAMLISILSSSQESALGIAFGVWLLLEALIDALLLGVLIRQQLRVELVLGAALLNPIQACRTASVALFDPEMSILGPLSYTLIDTLGRTGLLAWALAWPAAIGLGAAGLGYRIFRRSDIV